MITLETKTFGINLRTWRKKSGYTPEALALLLDASVATYYRYEREETMPDHIVLKKLCETFSCTPNDLYGFSDTFSVGSRALKAARIMDQMPDALQELTLLVINGIKIQGEVLDIGKYLQNINNAAHNTTKK